MTRDQNISFRATEEDREIINMLCEQTGLSQSQLLRALIRLPQPDAGMVPGTAYVVDTKAVALCAREMNRWGHHYNQAVHALNTLAFYIRHGDPPNDDAMTVALEDASRKLEEVEQGRKTLQAALAAIASSVIVRGD